MLPVLGGVVVLLGSYFAARTLRDNELSKATEMLGSSAPSVRIAGVHQLGIIGMNVPRFRQYAELTLRGFVQGDAEFEDEASRRFALAVLRQLDGPGEAEVGVLAVNVTDAFPPT
jgi:hypothetical protein